MSRVATGNIKTAHELMAELTSVESDKNLHVMVLMGKDDNQFTVKLPIDSLHITNDAVEIVVPFDAAQVIWSASHGDI